jgi:multidrug efflux pump subunit AcrA (membrane-fusion protein)
MFRGLPCRILIDGKRYFIHDSFSRPERYYPDDTAIRKGSNLKPVSRRHPIPILLAGLIAAGFLLSCQSAGGRGEEQSYVKAARRDFSSTVLATGSVKAQVGAEVRVGSRVSGRVQRLYVNTGDTVKKGDIIAELEKADLLATVDQRRADLETARARLSALENVYPQEVSKAEADVARWEATVSLTEKDLARKNDLIKDDLASQQDVDNAAQQLAVAQADLRVAREQLKLIQAQYAENIRGARSDVVSSQAALDNSRALLSYTTITAPISGVIGSVSTQQGETVAAGFNAPTFVTIIDLKRLQVEAFVDEVDIGKIALGQRATFTVDAFPGREFEGAVETIYPKAVIQENVVYYDVVVRIEGEYENVLRSEMTASVTIFLDSRKGVLAIPAGSVRREGGRNVAYVLADGRPERREISVGWRDGQWIEVTAGLTEGQEVLLAPPAEKKVQPE